MEKFYYGFALVQNLKTNEVRVFMATSRTDNTLNGFCRYIQAIATLFWEVRVHNIKIHFAEIKEVIFVTLPEIHVN